MEQNLKKKKFFYLEPDTHQKLKVLSAQKNIPLYKLIDDILSQWINENK
jgi:hypothetical protein